MMAGGIHRSCGGLSNCLRRRSVDGKAAAVLIRGYVYDPAPGTAKAVIRPAEADLFR
jgi:hypothetical protein